MTTVNKTQSSPKKQTPKSRRHLSPASRDGSDRLVPTAIRFTPEERAALEGLQRREGLTSLSHAMRWLLAQYAA